MKYIARLLIGALLLVIIAVPASAESIRAYVSTNTLKCYSSNSTSSSHLGTLGYGESVTCLAYDSTWALIEIGGERGYCKVSGLTTENPNTGSITAYVVAGGAKAYTRPGTSFKSASIEGGTKLTVVAMTPDKAWCRVKKSGSYAYMKTANLTTQKPEESDIKTFSAITAYIADETVAIHSSASGSSEKLAIAAYGEKVSCSAIDGSWAKIKYSGITGWCNLNKLTTENPNTHSLTVYASSASVRIYSHPSASSDVLATLTSGDSIKAVCATPDGSWLRVTASGNYGYVKKSAMSATKPVTVTDKLIELAYEQLGKPYIYAAKGPNAFDCSGYTSYCYSKAAGITLGRSAQAQGYYGSYEKIDSYSELRRGDMVCFDTEPDDSDLCDHVGIYLGNGKFIHASSARGEVIISTMSSGYYRQVFSWGRRVIE